MRKPVAASAAAASAEENILLTEVVDRVGIITLNRPHRMNALNAALIEALHVATNDMAADPGVKVLVLTGAPREGAAGGFCAGGDVKGSSGPGMAFGVPVDALEGDLARHDEHAAMQFHQMPKPTIAMVGGPAVGAGFSLAGACDFRVASTDAIFTAGFTPNGLAGDYGGTLWWTRICNTAVARRMYLLNERFTAEQALAEGMVTEVVEPDRLRERTLELAAQLTRTSATLLARVKDNLNQAEDVTDRRRFLVANEAEHQHGSMRDLRAKFAAKAAAE